MWYETLPPMAIILTALALPNIAAGYFNQTVYGNKYRRNFPSTYERYMFHRDIRINGAPWKTRGLESVPDE